MPIAHANDADGSIRTPATRCALVGLKPTRPYVEEPIADGEPLRAVDAIDAATRALEHIGHHVDEVHPPVLDGPAAGLTLGQLVMAGRWCRPSGSPAG